MNAPDFILFLAASFGAGLVIGRLLAPLIIQGGRRP
jgi:hypothetical protein